MQRACVMLGSVNVNIELPEPEAEVMPGVRWGDVAAFPTPAYWAYQVMARRIERNAIRYRLGTSLKEEVGACLLGGHGIPAKVGVVAFEHLRRRGQIMVAPGEPGGNLTLGLLQFLLGAAEGLFIQKIAQ